MSLIEELNRIIESSKTTLSAESSAIMEEAAGQLDALGVGDDAHGVGDMFPDATMKDATGRTVSIKNLLNAGPLVVTFYRGGWCPYCNVELKAYQNILGELSKKGATLVAVSAEKPDTSLTTVEKNNLSFPVLTDEGNQLAQSLGIAFEMPEELVKLFQKFELDLPNRNEKSEWTLPIPATFLVGRNGKILLAHVDRDYRKRLEPAEVLARL